jgi:hypothetical protein
MLLHVTECTGRVLLVSDTNYCAMLLIGRAVLVSNRKVRLLIAAIGIGKVCNSSCH